MNAVNFESSFKKTWLDFSFMFLNKKISTCNVFGYMLYTIKHTSENVDSQFSCDMIMNHRMMTKNSQLENEKAQKEAEAQKLFEENVRLRAQLDQKEAQLVAMNEQFKFMALNDPNF